MGVDVIIVANKVAGKERFRKIFCGAAPGEFYWGTGYDND